MDKCPHSSDLTSWPHLALLTTLLTWLWLQSLVQFPCYLIHSSDTLYTLGTRGPAVKRTLTATTTWRWQAQGFSTSALVTYWARWSFVVGAVLCIIGCLATSLASTYKMTVAPPSQLWHRKCLQTQLWMRSTALPLCLHHKAVLPLPIPQREPPRDLVWIIFLFFPILFPEFDLNHSIFIYQIPCTWMPLGLFYLADP